MPAIWMDPTTADSLPMQFKRENWFFQDITNHRNPTMSKFKDRKVNYPTQLYQQDLVNRLQNTSNPDRAWAELGVLSSFQNRYFRSSFGVESSQWLYERLQDMVVANNRTADTTVELFTHAWPQDSIIATIRPSSGNTETVILGAHCDSIASNMPDGLAPGANDDGSGSVTIMEVFRILLENNYHPLRQLEFHWYAAEEVGLLGSADIAANYAEEGRDVVAMFNSDMGSYNPEGNSVYRVMFDVLFMDNELTNYLHLLTNYTSLRVIEGSYGYAASDHAAWAVLGFPACHATESNPYPPIHTAVDVMSNLDKNYMWEFLGPALGFAVELTSATAL